ncbi:MAG: lipocalin family protein [Saprospiraceae bacterium]|nr:lipocalin family protein [Saprospiraceae bacterium]
MKYSLPLIFFLLVSCYLETNKPLIIGEWEMVEWRIVSTGQEVKGRQMDFDFNADDTYKVDYGSQTETGEWRVAGNNLFTTEEGMAEKMVKILKINEDTLKFEMNRSGRLEHVTLVKE